MDRHPIILDFFINVLCVISCLLYGNYLYYKKHIDINFGSSILFSILWLLVYLFAKIFHVSWILVPINGGIPWSKSGFFLFLFFLGVVAAIYNYIKSRKKQPPILDK